MMPIPKKYLFLLIPVAIAGAWWFSAQRTESFSNDIPASRDSSVRPAAVSDSDMNGVEGGGNGNVENGNAGTATVADGVTGSNGIKGMQGEETGGKGTVDKGNISIIDRLVSFGFEKRSSRSIDTVIVHSSYDALGSDPYSVSGVIAEYEQSGVSPHYLIDRKGKVYRLVQDHDVAYHAGVSKMPDGRTGVNGFSIGIEVIEKDTDSPTSAQYASLRSLIASLKSAYPIKYVLGHSDIAPGRKTDPWNFDWKEIP